MRETAETTFLRTLIIDQGEIEKIIHDSLLPEWLGANVSVYQKTIPASSVMGTIDDIETIECKVILQTTITS